MAQRLYSGTRMYNQDTARSRAVATSSTAFALVDVGIGRELHMLGNVRLWYRFGTSNAVTASVRGDGCMLLEERTPWHQQVPEGMTHIAVIAESAGFVTITSVM